MIIKVDTTGCTTKQIREVVHKMEKLHNVRYNWGCSAGDISHAKVVACSCGYIVTSVSQNSGWLPIGPLTPAAELLGTLGGL